MYQTGRCRAYGGVAPRFTGFVTRCLDSWPVLLDPHPNASPRAQHECFGYRVLLQVCGNEDRSFFSTVVDLCGDEICVDTASTSPPTYTLSPASQSPAVSPSWIRSPSPEPSRIITMEDYIHSDAQMDAIINSLCGENGAEEGAPVPGPSSGSSTVRLLSPNVMM